MLLKILLFFFFINDLKAETYNGINFLAIGPVYLESEIQKDNATVRFKITSQSFLLPSDCKDTIEKISIKIFTNQDVPVINQTYIINKQFFFKNYDNIVDAHLVVYTVSARSFETKTVYQKEFVHLIKNSSLIKIKNIVFYQKKEWIQNKSEQITENYTCDQKNLYNVDITVEEIGKESMALVDCYLLINQKIIDKKTITILPGDTNKCNFIMNLSKDIISFKIIEKNQSYSEVFNFTN